LKDFHFHFITKDQKIGGHVSEVTFKEAKIELQNCHKFEQEYANTEELYNYKKLSSEEITNILAKVGYNHYK
jgi:acetolactate decarboxylase